MTISQATADPPAEGHPEQDGTIPFRVRVGVTGHRRIDNREEVARGVADRLEKVSELYGSTRYTPVAFSILSALAEGADRLVAKVALEANRGPEVELTAVLPLRVADYLEDFESDASRLEFEDLLGCSAVRLELERRRSPERHEREAAYDRAGRYIVDHCDVLIALWDGHEPQGQGGTGEIVEYARQQGVPVLIVPASGGQDGIAVSLEDLEPAKEPARQRAARDAFRRIDHYNRVSLRSSRERKSMDAERARLGRPLEGSSMHWRCMHIADWALPHLARADKLAVANHRRQTTLAWAIHLLAAFAVADVAVQTLFLGREPLWLVGEIFLVGMLLLAVAIGRHARLHDRWIGYRSMAEGFRSALFFALSGGDHHRRAASMGVLGEPDEAWFQRAFSEAWRYCPEIELEHGDAAPLRNFLVEAWIDHQILYHRDTARRWRARHNLFTWIMGALALATVAVAVLHIAKVGHGSWVAGALKLAALTLPAFGGAVAGLREYGQLRLHEERSRRAVARLQGLKDRLTASSTLRSVRRLAADTQRVMVDETLDWYGVVEFQEVDIVI